MRRQKIAGEVESRNLVRQLLMCLQKDDEKKPASTGPAAGWGWALQAVGHKSSRGMKCPWSSVQAGTVPGPAEAGQEVCGQPLTSGKPRSVPDGAPPPHSPGTHTLTAQCPLHHEITHAPWSLRLSGLPKGGQPGEPQAESSEMSSHCCIINMSTGYSSSTGRDAEIQELGEWQEKDRNPALRLVLLGAWGPLSVERGENEIV